MMNLNMRVKSAALAVAMVVSSTTVCNVSDSVVETAVKCIKNNKVASLCMLALIAAKVRLMTKPRGVLSMENFRQDVDNVFASYNIFDAQARATIMSFVDKYFVGLEFKLDDTTTRTKLEDGGVFTIKGKKLTQKPFGVMGLFDAYVLAQLKKITEYVPAMAAFYVLVNNPAQTFENAAKKAS